MRRSESITQRAHAWAVSGRTGESPEAIWAVMMGVDRAEIRWPTTPLDADDFDRCYRLLRLVPEWRPRLREVARAYPSWARIVDVWDELVALYEERRLRELDARLREVA